MLKDLHNTMTNDWWVCAVCVFGFLQLAGRALESDAIPPPQGEYYETQVPDTLDLAERARLAIGGLTGSVDPGHGYVQYFMGRLAADPPYLIHMDYGDIICTAKWLESLPMMRVMTGSDHNLQVEQKMRQDLVGRLGEDGLVYISKDEIARTSWLSKRGDYPMAEEDLTALIHDGRAMLAMMAFYERDRDPVWLERIGRMADSLVRIAVHKDDYAFYPEGKIGMEFSYLKQSGYHYTEEPASETEGAESSVLNYQGNQIRALARWYMMSGDERALELARKLVNFVTKPKLWNADHEHERIAGSERGRFRHTHIHARHTTTRGILEYARATNDQFLKEFVRDAYEYSRNWGIGRIGFFGQSVGGIDATVEGCSIADMLALAIRLSDYGIGDYWDDVDQVVRNQFAEQQLIHRDRLERIAAASRGADGDFAELEAKLASWGPKFYDGLLQRSTPDPGDAIGRSLGLFAGASFATAITYPVQLGCCSGNCTNALYYVWESIVRFKDGVAQINLLLNRVSPWLDIESHLPYEGKVVVRNKRAKRVSLRIPRWIDRESIKSAVNEKQTTPYWVGNYFVIDELAPGDVLQIEFPMVEKTLQYTLPFDKKYSIHFKGNTVVDISPRDTYAASYPIYLRDHYGRKKAPLKKVTRFVATEVLDW